MERSFEDLLAEAWSRLEPLRHQTQEEPLLKWQRLSPLTSENGVLCGLSVYSKGLVRRRPIAEIHLAYDWLAPCYRVSSWRRGHLPVEVFPGPESPEQPTLDSAIAKISDMIETLIPLLAAGKIKTSYPPEWVGKSGLSILKEAIFKKRGSAV